MGKKASESQKEMNRHLCQKRAGDLLYKLKTAEIVSLRKSKIGNIAGVEGSGIEDDREQGSRNTRFLERDERESGRSFGNFIKWACGKCVRLKER